jgi:hypothetical protein
LRHRGVGQRRRRRRPLDRREQGRADLHQPPEVLAPDNAQRASFGDSAVGVHAKPGFGHRHGAVGSEDAKAVLGRQEPLPVPHEIPCAGVSLALGGVDDEQARSDDGQVERISRRFQNAGREIHAWTSHFDGADRCQNIAGEIFRNDRLVDCDQIGLEARRVDVGKVVGQDVDA